MFIKNYFSDLKREKEREREDACIISGEDKRFELWWEREKKWHGRVKSPARRRRVIFKLASPRTISSPISKFAQFSLFFFFFFSFFFIYSPFGS